MKSQRRIRLIKNNNVDYINRKYNKKESFLCNVLSYVILNNITVEVLKISVGSSRIRVNVESHWSNNLFVVTILRTACKGD